MLNLPSTNKNAAYLTTFYKKILNLLISGVAYTSL